MARRGNRAGQTSAPRTPETEQAARVLTQAKPLLDVLSAQLKDVVSNTEDAAFSVISGAQQADAEAEALAEFAGNLARETGAHAQRVAAATQASADQVEEMVSLVSERYSSVLGLVEDVRGLQRYVEAIAAVSRATTILALNAKIEAARAGAAGQGFAVVADEVRALSKQSASAAEDIRTGIAQVSAVMAEKLGGGGSSGSTFEAINDQLHSIATDQREVAGMLSSTVAETQAAVSQIETSANSLSQRTNAIVASVQFQDITRQSVEAVVAALSGLDDRLEAVGDYLADSGNSASLLALGDGVEDLSASYVSQRQRAIHAKTAGTGAAEAGPIIELF